VAVNSVDAYAWPPSVAQGDTVGLYASTDANWLNLTIHRVGEDTTSYYSAHHLAGVQQVVPDSVWETGCGWSPTLLLPVPETWPSGLYLAEFRTNGESKWEDYAVFVVREDDPASSSARILYQVPITTWQAYNNWGGKSLYDHNSTDFTKATTVSFQRPYASFDGRGKLPQYDAFMVEWLEEEGYAVDYCTSLDLHAFPGLESHYDLLLSVGHDEYWTKEMRDNVEARIAGGGNVAFFSGNVCWWQIRFSGDLSRMTCFRQAAQDPLTGIDDSRVTVNWCSAPVLRPENTMTGVSFRNGGYVNNGTWYPASQGYGGYTAYRTDHWVYSGTGLVDGEVFGQEQTIVGHEVDGSLFTWSAGLPECTGEDSTPSDFTILAVSPASNGSGTMGVYYRGGGFVFTAATIEWAQGLPENPVVGRITRNVINRSLATPTGVGEGGLPALLTGNAPNPFRSSTLISFSTTKEGDARLRIYDVEGRLVNTLIEGPLPPGSHAVRWNGEDDAGRRVPPGVYFYRLQGDDGSACRKLVRVN